MQLLLSPQHKPVQDDFMEWPSAELCRPAGQHGWCCHEEVSARSSPQVCVSHGVTSVIHWTDTGLKHWTDTFSMAAVHVTQNLKCYAILTYNRDSLYFSSSHVNLEGWRCHSVGCVQCSQRKCSKYASWIIDNNIIFTFLKLLFLECFWFVLIHTQKV